jgi:hypothetical protein
MDREPFQFNLKTVFVVTTLAAIVLGICHYLTAIGLTLLAFWILIPGLAFTSFIVCVQLGSLARSIFRWLLRRPPEPHS